MRQMNLYGKENPWTNFLARGKTFDVPGMPEEIRGNVVVQQPLELECTVEASTPTDYRVVIRDREMNILGQFPGTTGKESDDCGISLDNIDPGTKYEIAIFSEGQRLSSGEFEITVGFYDGIPTNMNNKSTWLGPKIEFGPFNLRPTIFLNFFGLTFFLLLYPLHYTGKK